MFLDNLLQPTHLLIVLAVALIVLGPKRLPEVGHALGKGLRDFRDAVSGDRQEQHDALASAPVIAETASPVVAETAAHAAPVAAPTAQTPAAHAAPVASPTAQTPPAANEPAERSS
jgi:sec-independent protein translocase protein TatA